MSALEPLIDSARRRLGLSVATSWRPQTPGLRESLAALEAGDHRRAIDVFTSAAGVRPHDDDGRVVQETILLSLEHRITKLEDDIQHHERLRNTADGEIALLRLRLERRRFQRDRRVIWLTLAAALVIVISTVVSVVYFALPAWIGAIGLGFFALAAITLLRVDFGRQAAEFEAKLAEERAGAMEEIQILRAEIRDREQRVAALRQELDQFVNLGKQVTGAA